MGNGNTRDMQVEVFPNNIAVRVVTSPQSVSAGCTVGDFIDALLALASRNEVLASIEYQGTGAKIFPVREGGGVEIWEERP